MKNTVKKVVLIGCVVIIASILMMIGVMGTDSYTTISTPSDFLNIANNLNGKYKLANDIDFTGIDYVALGNEQTPFTGVLDGGGFTVKNLTVNAQSESDVYAAIFAYNAGEITNLKFDNVKVNASSDNSVYAAVVVAVNSGEIKDVTVTNAEIEANAKYGVARASGVSAYTTGVGNIDSCSVSVTKATATSQEMYAYKDAINTSDLGDVVNCAGTLENDFVYGDVNSSGSIDIFDLIALAKHIVDSSFEVNTSAADVNGSGAIDIFDLIRLAKYIVDPSTQLGPQA